MEAGIPTMSLKTFNWQPVAYQSTQYTPIQSANTLLAKSMLQQENREGNARTQLDTIDKALMSYRANLDPSDHAWFDARKNQIREDINREINLGNYQSAIRIAQQDASDLTSDSDLQNRILVNGLRQQARQQINTNGRLDSLTKLRWEEMNPYVYNGTANWSATWNPVDDISLEQVWSIAVQMTPEQSRGDSVTNQGMTTQTYVDSDGNPTTDPSKAVRATTTTKTSESGHSSTVHTKTSKQIETTFNNLLREPKYRLALQQRFDNYIWAYNKAIKDSEDSSLSEADRAAAAKKVEEYKPFVTNENGILYNTSVDENGNVTYDKSVFDKWISDKSKPMFMSMSYRNTTSGRINGSSSTAIDPTQLAGNQAAANAQDTYVPEQVEVPGTPISMQYNWTPSVYNSNEFNNWFIQR